jgi:hypothetical protein
MLRILLVAAALCVSSLAARADTVFDLNATLQYGSISGTITLNDSSTAFSGIDLTFVDDFRDEVWTFTTINAQQIPWTTVAPMLSVFTSVTESPNGRLFVEFNLPVDSLAGYDGGTICTSTFTLACSTTLGYPYPVGIDSFLTGTGDPYDGFLSGTLTPVPSMTPEPSAFALLGTGLLGVAGVVRKRFA